MKSLSKAALAIVLAFLMSNTTRAADYLTDATQALQHASVYVAPGTEGTDSDTVAKLQARLRNNDNIVLVMLPSTAESELNADINTIASRLSDNLGNKRIIGLAVGNNVVGYAPTLPQGVATDLMRRAKSVSNDPVTALGTFAQNVHQWEAENPQPTPTPIPTRSTATSSQTGKVGGLFAAVVFVVCIVAVLVLIYVIYGKSAKKTDERTHFKAPDHVKNLLTKIAQQRELVNDGELKRALYDMCLDTEKYFQSSSKDKGRDSAFFTDRLMEVTQVLDKYIDVQQNPRYYFDPDDELKKGKSSILDFSKYVLESIRRGNEAGLLNYSVNTNILQAQRYR